MILVISGLNISDEDIKALHVVYDEESKEDKYKIVWISIISKLTQEEDQKRYDYVRSTMKWYAVPYATKIAGIRFLEENWQLRDDPLVVVMNSKSKVQFNNAIHLVRVWGIDAIPFTHERSDILLRKNWPDSTIFKFIDHPRLTSWVCTSIYCKNASTFIFSISLNHFVLLRLTKKRVSYFTEEKTLSGSNSSRRK